MVERLPEIENCQYLFSILQRVGFYSLGMAGAVPIAWQDLAAWQQANQIQLTPLELTLLKQLSSDYCAQLQKSASHTEMPPAAISLDGSDFDRTYMSEVNKRG